LNKKNTEVQEFRSSGVQEFRRILESVAAPSELLWTN
jgi:hypothetical protein